MATTSTDQNRIAIEDVEASLAKNNPDGNKPSP
jgi:hypothetical protein